jgi:RNA polymerase sigma factor (sigma-70 family)
MSLPPDEASFPQTRWTVVVKAGAVAQTAAGREALSTLCRTYWYPLYAFARRSGRGVEDAQDLTQGFFVYVLERNLFARANPERGKLRTFLLTAFERYMRDAYERDQAEKRGGGVEVLPLGEADGEERYAREPVEAMTPERLFARAWAYDMLAAALVEVRKRETTAGRERQFTELKAFISLSGAKEQGYSSIAQRLGTTEAAVQQAVSRLRERFRKVLRSQIADTLYERSEPAIEEELAFLRASLRG